MSLHGHQYCGRFSDGEQTARHFCERFHSDSSSLSLSVPAVAVATAKISSLLPSVNILWSALCKHQQPLFPLLLTSLAELQAAPSSAVCPQALSRGHFICTTGRLAVYITAIYNRLIHLWPLHFTGHSNDQRASGHFYLMRVKKCLRLVSMSVHCLQMFARL